MAAVKKLEHNDQVLDYWHETQRKGFILYVSHEPVIVTIQWEDKTKQAVKATEFIWEEGDHGNMWNEEHKTWVLM